MCIQNVWGKKSDVQASIIAGHFRKVSIVYACRSLAHLSWYTLIPTKGVFGAQYAYSRLCWTGFIHPVSCVQWKKQAKGNRIEK